MMPQKHKLLDGGQRRAQYATLRPQGTGLLPLLDALVAALDEMAQDEPGPDWSLERVTLARDNPGKRGGPVGRWHLAVYHFHTSSGREPQR